ncbi:DUF3810 domain-containing protein [Niastella caeni]|uniref:DUF3810 domain-containing protein n=1 Tax=Niastella caeni TaxID=2569763 RepID=A0A4S8I245_9BACT|nr:DUF3810 domain-containing protein [Niastella caeni]THU40634.1 DUF3810 domain-containing protein [Niastella caeni]
MWRKKNAWLVLIGLAISIKIFSLFPDAVEKYYASGIYPVISKLQRILFGWLPFSVGDIFYGLVIIWLLYKLYHTTRRIVKRQTNKKYWLHALLQTAFVVVVVYVSFNLLWGLNYNRRGVAYQLGLKVERYSKNDLVQLMQTIVYRLHALDSPSRVNRQALARKRNLFDGAVSAYGQLAHNETKFTYSFQSVKPSLYSYLGNYLGYTGYYNPFSGEAQVNTTVPLFVQPFTTCHEIGHQLGYAKENEANFAGYLSAKSSQDALFRYSVYFDLYSYSRYYLYAQDSITAKQLDAQLPAGIKADHRVLREFVKKYRNPVEVIIDKLYGEYLKANEQPGGKLSYNEVVAWLVAYYKKFGTEAI